jgi:uncharacterized Tic20 family protein
MTITRFFDGFLIAALVCLACLGAGRAVALYARGIAVVVIDRERSLTQAVGDLFVVVLFLVWAYENVAYAWPLRIHVVPPPLGAVLIDTAALKVVGALLVVAGL